MKRFIFLLIILIFVLSFTICSFGSALPHFVVGYSAGDYGQEFHRRGIDTTVELAKKFGIEIKILDSKRDPALQLNHIEQFITLGVDAIVLSANSAEGIVPTIKKLNSLGIPVFSVLDAPTGGDFYYIGSLYYKNAGSEVAAEYLAKVLNGKGNIVYIRGIPSNITDLARDVGFRNILNENPDMKIIWEKHGDYSRPSGMQIMEDALSRFPEKGSINAVFAHNDLMCLGALQAAERLGRANEIMFASVDGDPESVKAVADKRQNVTAFQNIEAIGRWAAIRLVQKLYGIDIPKVTSVPISSCNQENAEMFVGLTDRIKSIQEYYNELEPINMDSIPEFK